MIGFLSDKINLLDNAHVEVIGTRGAVVFMRGAKRIEYGRTKRYIRFEIQRVVQHRDLLTDAACALDNAYQRAGDETPAPTGEHP